MELYEVLIPFDESGDGYRFYDDDDDRYIGDVIERWLRDNKVEQYNIEEVTAFESCGYDVSVLCVAWVAANGKLNAYNLLLERC